MDNNCKNNFKNIEDNIMAVIKEVKMAYNKGTDDGYAQGYKQGIADGNIADGTLEKKIKKAYQNGLNDAWECAKHIAENKTSKEWENFFDYFKVDAFKPHLIFEKYTAIDAIAMMKEYKSKENKKNWIKDYKKGLCICPTCGNEQRFLTDRCSKCGQLMEGYEHNNKKDKTI